MKIKFFKENNKSKLIKKKIIVSLNKILKTGQYTNGPFVKNFEDNFKKFVQTKYCVAVNSGTSALQLSLIALGIKKNDEVIVPSISFVASAAAITYLGAKPVFVDINSNNWLINCKKIEEKINKKTKAIMPVHLHGLMCDMRAIQKIAKKYKLRIIEDASQAHGSTYFGKKPGYYSDVATFSFYPTKNLGAIGEGGAILTNDIKIFKRTSNLRAWSPGGKFFSEIGFNCRMPEIIAASLCEKLKYLDDDIEKRITIANYYKQKLNNKNFISFDKKKLKHVYHIFALTLKNRNIFRKILKEKNIDTAIHYEYCLPMLKIFSNFKKKNESFPVGRRISNELVSLPLYPELTKKELNYIIKTINNIK